MEVGELCPSMAKQVYTGVGGSTSGQGQKPCLLLKTDMLTETMPSFKAKQSCAGDTYMENSMAIEEMVLTYRAACTQGDRQQQWAGIPEPY